MVVIMDAAIDNQIRDLNSLYLIISVLGVLVINMTMFYLFSKLGKEGQLALENRLLRQQNKYERKNMEDLKRFYDQTRNMKHEMKNHLLYIAHAVSYTHLKSFCVPTSASQRESRNRNCPWRLWQSASLNC